MLLSPNATGSCYYFGDNFSPAFPSANYVATSCLPTPNILPELHLNRIEWPAKPSDAVLGTLSLASPLLFYGTGDLRSADFRYSEVGYFRLLKDAVIDTTLSAFSNDQVNGDCLPNNTQNTPDISGKVGCHVGSSVSPYLGRFLPMQYSLDWQGGQIDLTNGRGYKRLSAYANQPLSLTISATDDAGKLLTNYAGDYAKDLYITPQSFLISDLIGAVQGDASPAVPT